jgi:hypothetical protein
MAANAVSIFSGIQREQFQNTTAMVGFNAARLLSRGALEESQFAVLRRPVSGSPCNLNVGEALLAQSLKRGKYFLTGLSVLQAGSAALCRSAGDHTLPRGMDLTWAWP